jgi:MFS family permease
MDTAAHSPGGENAYKTTILVVMSFVSFLTAFMGSASNLALPAIGREFNATAVQLGWVMSGFMLAAAICLLPFGRLGDIFGRKRIFSLGLLIFTAMTLLAVFSWDINVLIFLRVVQGFSGSMLFGTNMAIVSSVFSPGERGKALGITTTSVYLGLSAGPVLGGLLTHAFGWRSIFIALVPLEIIALVLFRLRVKTEWTDAAGEKFDWKGSIVYGAALFSLMYGFSMLPAAAGWSFLGAGVALAAAFVLVELKAASPIFKLNLVLTNRIFAFSLLAALINYAATSAIGFYLSLYLQYLKSLDAGTAGLIMISQPFAMALMSPVAGRLSDRKNPGIIASIGMGVTTIGLVLLCFINEHTPLAYLVALLVMFGAGFGLFSSPNSNAVMSSVERKYLGIASALLGTMRSVGQMLSMGIAMMLMSLYIGREPISPATYPGLVMAMQTGFLTLAILSVFGIFASLARNRR